MKRTDLVKGNLIESKKGVIELIVLEVLDKEIKVLEETSKEGTYTIKLKKVSTILSGYNLKEENFKNLDSYKFNIIDTTIEGYSIVELEEVTLVEEALAEAGLSTTLGKIGEKVEEEEKEEEYKIEVGDIYKSFRTLKAYKVKEVKEGKVVLEGIETRGLTTSISTLLNNYYLDSKVEKLDTEKELDKELERVQNTSIEELKKEVEEEIAPTLEEVYPSSLGIELSKEELFSYIRDYNLEKEDLKLNSKVIAILKDYSIHIGEVAYIGEFTLKVRELLDKNILGKVKEDNLFFKDLIGAFKGDIDLKLLEAYLKLLKEEGLNNTIEEEKAPKKASRGKKEVDNNILTLRVLVEELVREKLIFLDLEFNPNNTFKYIRRIIRKKGKALVSLRLEGYGYSFNIEDKRVLKEELYNLLKR